MKGLVTILFSFSQLDYGIGVRRRGRAQDLGCL